MKKILLLVLLTNFFSSSAQNWKIVTPFNNVNVIRDMEATPDGTLYVVADQPRAMFKKTLGSNTWDPMNFTNASVFGDPSDIQMLNNNVGYAISNFGRFAKTTDGWQTSTIIPVSTVSNDRIFFLDENNGYVFGYRRFIRKTIDGGANWTNLEIPSGLMSSGEDITDLEFINENTGFALDTDGNVFKTTDRGLTWTKIQLQASSYDLNELLFITENIGFAVGALGQIYRTDDQGITWTLNDTSANILHDIRYYNGVLYAVGESRSFLISTDMGITWSSVQTVNYPEGSLLDVRLYSVVLLNNDILVAGESGEIYKANNLNGTSWSLFYEPVWGNVVTSGLKFATQNKGLMVGAGNTQSAVYSTDNGGFSWKRQLLSSANFFKSIDLKPDGKGLVIGPNGFARTSDFGENWTTLAPIQPNVPYTKCWLKENNDFFVGTNPGTTLNDGLIFRNGNLWSIFPEVTKISEIKFLNENIGFAVTNTINFDAKLWKTTNGGISWSQMENYNGGHSDEIQIINENKIYIKNFSNIYSVSNDGGLSWTDLSNANYPTKVHFFDEQSGYGIDVNNKNVYRTTNGGSSWEIIIPNDNSLCGIEHLAWFVDKIVYSGALFKVCVLTIEQLLQVKSIDKELVDKIIVYPNPSSNIIKCSKFAKSLSVSDLTGKILGVYGYTDTIDISNLQKGIYILNVTLESGIELSQKIYRN